MAFSGRFSSLFTGCLLVASGVLQAMGYDNSRSDNARLAVYYGQNSYGATHPDTANWQRDISAYCQDDAINAIPLAFLHVFFSAGGLPEINMANTCSSNSGVFPGTNLANCQFMAAGIKSCQARGKIITLSLGGATGAAGFSSDAQAQTFADTVWNVFLGGSSSTRPFGDAVLDGIDLDIEGGSSTGYAAFVSRIRSHASGASKKYYITAAPQCPFPDAWLGPALNAVAFDAVYVQYNNFCGVQNFNNPNAWNFGTWDNWAKTISPNRNVKVYIGVPAAPSAAGSGYVDAATLGDIARQTRAKYSSFGGIMLWDASQAYGNGRFDLAVKNALGSGSGGPPPTTTTTTRDGGGGSGCGGVAAWAAGVIYVGGSTASYNGHLWTAKWWTQGDTPGGNADVWRDNGACLAKAATAAASATAAAHPSTTVVNKASPAPAPKPKPNGTAAPKAGSVSSPKATASAESTDEKARRSPSRLFRI